MTTIYSAKINNATWDKAGNLSFYHEGRKYWTDDQPHIDNIAPGVAGYLATLYTYDEDFCSDEPAGKVVWEIINHDSGDASDACNWDDFTVRFF